MVIDAKLPHTLWEYAARHAVYVHSQVAVTRLPAVSIGFQEDRTGTHAYTQEPTAKVWHIRDFEFIAPVDSSSKVIVRELKALEETNTGALIELPPGETTLGYILQYRLKHDANMELTYKARVRARDDRKDFVFGEVEVYAPVAKLASCSRSS
ncbi:hypothetical protein PHYSODRAFT_331908 [Phytophthora sojae]|uniref:Uncharacterized protein n=1 Tax=Phytophthora sojae (strain P6497) TaxID=1094619 RepID=G4ZGW3_PHYSP|nr:hypothetical protein PHYSODRAFT_331908 [Phytophthora sojae]EGZ18029.1 hypothetical protein PHYSODRAFT_331908 [Phytophthora sojae]|eukprot:XP_009527087.1 hypothetical protein PHYSODRAFT_331908 [Phytophthora sojae]